MECTIIRFVAFSAPRDADVQPPEPEVPGVRWYSPGATRGHTALVIPCLRLSSRWSRVTGHTVPGARDDAAWG